MFVHLAVWTALLARSPASKDAELLVLRQEGRGAAAAEPQVEAGLGGQAVLTALPRLRALAADEGTGQPRNRLFERHRYRTRVLAELASRHLLRIADEG